MSVSVDFAGLCLFLRGPDEEFNVLLGGGHKNSHTPYLTIETKFCVFSEDTPRPDHVIVIAGTPPRQFAIWNITNLHIDIGTGGGVEAEHKIAKDVGPPRPWGDLHWVVNMTELHDAEPFKGHPHTPKKRPNIPGLVARVQLTGGELTTVEPENERKYAVVNSATEKGEFERYFADTLRFSSRATVLTLRRLNGSKIKKIELRPGALASITCQSTEPQGGLEHFEHYYDFKHPTENPTKRELRQAKRRRRENARGDRDGFPIDCVPPGTGGP